MVEERTEVAATRVAARVNIVGRVGVERVE
jgi:hypothetical protein